MSRRVPAGWLDSRTGIFPVLFLLAVCVPHDAVAQFTVRSWMPWRTVETRHFALHYPVALEAWTLDLSTRIEAIDSAVSQVVGYSPHGKTDIVVDDPYETANGSAWPYLRRPLINLWATPPDPRDDIGEFSRWNDMVASHEFGHIAHLVRPSRNEALRRLWELLPVDLGPIATRSPRWAIEGYATFIEGRVTGSGRPHGTWRPAFLRQWALEGQLPTYEQLDAWGAYEGGSFAYLAGSAFLEWLARQKGDSSLIDVWRRLSAKQNRTFDEAFSGVFGESPRALYGRFSAELTSDAMAIERALRTAARADTGAIVQRTAWSTGDPAISADGRRAALVLRSATMPSRVVIWKTAPEPDTARPRRDSILLAHDPEDVPAHPIYPAPKKPVATLRAPGGAPYESPRFLPDGRVVLWRRVARGDGSLTSDLYVWDPERRHVTRVTHDAELRDPDPTRDGRSVVATQCRHGWCDVVAVDLSTGVVRAILEGSPARSFYKPRLAPDSRGGIVSVATGGRWRLARFRLDVPATDSLVMVASDDRGNEYDASFVSRDTVVAVSDASGIPNLVRVDLATGATESLTHVTGAAVAPVLNPSDGSVWFLSLYSRGYDVRRLATAQPTVPRISLDASQSAATAARQAALRAFPANPVDQPRAFGFGPRLLRWFPQPQLDADGASVALGVSSSDIIGRSEILITGAAGNPAASRGASVELTWRGARPALRAAAFGTEQTPTASRAGRLAPAFLDLRMAGGEVAVDETDQWDTWALHYRLAASAASVTPTAAALSSDASSNRSLVVGDGLVAHTWRGLTTSLTANLGVSYALGRSFDKSFGRATGTAGLTARASGLPSLSATAAAGALSTGAPFEQFVLGGGPTPLLDRELLTQRLLMPALPVGVQGGPTALAYRVALGGLPISGYWWAGSTAARGDRFVRWNRVVGAEWTQTLPQIALAGTPAARVQLGVGRSLDEPFRRKTRAYVSLVLNP